MPEANAPSSDPRRYGVRSVPAQITWMGGVAVFIAYLLFLTLIATGPAETALDRSVKIAQSIQPGDAWAYLGVFAAFVVAIQVTAWSTQQDSRFGRTRAPRFTAAAVTTGALTIVAEVAFLVALSGKNPGPLALMLTAGAGIVFFAADGASIVLLRDRRQSLRTEIAGTAARARATLPAEYRANPNAFKTLSMAVISGISWSILVSFVPYVALLGATAALGNGVNLGAAAGGYAGALLLIGILTAISVADVLAIWSWIGNRRTARGYAVAAFVAIALALLQAGSLSGFIVLGSTTGKHWTLTAATTVILFTPAMLPFTALIAAQHPSPRGRTWTPRAALRNGRVAATRLYVASLISGSKRLGKTFGDSASTD